MSVFDCLPLCAIINDSIFAVHAGISPFLHSIADIEVLDRFQEIPLISIAFYFELVYFLNYTKDYTAISCGQIQHHYKVGFRMIAVSATLLDKTNPSSFYTPII